MAIIGFTGLAGSGKSTASDYLVRTQGFVKINFKDALVAEMKERLGSVLEQMILLYENDPMMYDAGKPMTIDWLFENKPPLMRALMQAYGTEVRRRDNNNYWVSIWKEKVREAIRQGKNVVTDDVRFLNEAEAVHELNGKVIRIVRTDITFTGNHSSEVEQKDIAHDIALTCGKGDHEILYGLIEGFLKEHGKE